MATLKDLCLCKVVERLLSDFRTAFALPTGLGLPCDLIHEVSQIVASFRSLMLFSAKTGLSATREYHGSKDYYEGLARYRPWVLDPYKCMSYDHAFCVYRGLIDGGHHDLLGTFLHLFYPYRVPLTLTTRLASIKDTQAATAYELSLRALPPLYREFLDTATLLCSEATPNDERPELEGKICSLAARLYRDRDFAARDAVGSVVSRLPRRSAKALLRSFCKSVVDPRPCLDGLLNLDSPFGIFTRPADHDWRDNDNLNIAVYKAVFDHILDHEPLTVIADFLATRRYAGPACRGGVYSGSHARASLPCNDDKEAAIYHKRPDIYLYLIATGNGYHFITYWDLYALTSYCNPLICRYLHDVGVEQVLPQFARMCDSAGVRRLLEDLPYVRRRKLDKWLDRNIDACRLQARKLLGVTGLYSW